MYFGSFCSNLDQLVLPLDSRPPQNSEKRYRKKDEVVSFPNTQLKMWYLFGDSRPGIETQNASNRYRYSFNDRNVCNTILDHN